MTIDLTDRYFATEFMRGGAARWKLDRAAWPGRAIMLHSGEHPGHKPRPHLQD